jgi:hypothetical protein
MWASFLVINFLPIFFSKSWRESKDSQTESSNIDSNVIENKLSKSGSLSNSLLGILFS